MTRQTIPLKDQKRMIFWLGICAFMVIGMILLGGFTRLAGAGLSIVKWQPFLGILPPLSEEAWLQEFLLYQKFPEYQKVTSGISLQEFKTIFWIEYSHRLAGRLIGVIFLIPTLLCLKKNYLRKLLPSLIGVWFLGLLQGIIGWYMVKSGLVDRPWVSPYRLTLHLGLAFGILAALLWMIFSLLPRAWQREKNFKFRPLLIASFILILITIFLGGFTAGLKAGHIYNTFPTMNGQWIPSDLLFLNPLWQNFFENPTTVQFCHRWGAMITWSCVSVLIYQSLQLSLHPLTRLSFIILGSLLTTQLFLGIILLILQVPLLFALLHQLVAVLVFCVAWWLVYLTHKPKEDQTKLLL